MKRVSLFIFLSVVLSLCFVSVAGAVESTTIDVNGTQKNVYEVSGGFYQDGPKYDSSTNFYITNKEGLKYFRDWVNGTSAAMNNYSEKGFLNLTLADFASNNGFLGKNVYLLADIDLKNEVWQPIGPNSGSVPDKFASNWKAHFYGNFYGGNHVISNMDTSQSDQGDKYSRWPQGFFGSIAASGTIIDGLIFENVTVISKFSDGYAGAVVGDLGSNPCTISNCIVRGSITIKGGASGGIYGIGNGNVQNCQVLGDEGSRIEGYSFSGGLVGAQRVSETSDLKITDNTVKNLSIISSKYAGALVGAPASGASGKLAVEDNTIIMCLVNDGEASEETLISTSTPENWYTASLTVQNNTIVNPVAKIATTKYGSIQDAFDAAQTNDTVVLLRDVALSSSVRLNKSGTYTFDGDGKTISMASNANFGADGAFCFGSPGGGSESDIADKIFTLKNTTFTGFTTNEVIRCESCTLTIDGCSFDKNLIATGTSRGRNIVLFSHAAGTVQNSSFTENTTGKCIDFNSQASSANTGYGSLNVQHNRFYMNTIDDGGTGIIFAFGSQTGKDSVAYNDFESNQVNSSSGAVIYCSGTVQDLAHNFFSGNQVTTTGLSGKNGVIVLGSGSTNTIINANAFVDNTLSSAGSYGTVYVGNTLTDVNNNYWGDGQAPETGEKKDIYDPQNVAVWTAYASSYQREENYGVTVTLPSSIATPPTAKENLLCTGSPQALVEAGTPKNGTMQYALGDATGAAAESYSSDIPKGTEAGTYYVWYKVIGDEGYADTAAQGPITVTIKNAKPVITGGSISVVKGQTQTIEIKDNDGTGTRTWTLNNGNNAWITLAQNADNKATITAAPPVNISSTLYTCTVTVTNEEGEKASAEVNIYVSSGITADEVTTPQTEGTYTGTPASGTIEIIAGQSKTTSTTEFKSGTHKVLETEISITTESDNFVGMVNKEFSTLISIDVSLDIADPEFTNYGYSLDLSGLPEGLKVNGDIVSTDTVRDSFRHVFAITGIPAESSDVQVRINPVITVSSDKLALVSVASKYVQIEIEAAPEISAPELTVTPEQSITVSQDADIEITIKADKPVLNWIKSGDIEGVDGQANSNGDVYVLSGKVLATPGIYSVTIIASNGEKTSEVTISINITKTTPDDGETPDDNETPDDGKSIGDVVNIAPNPPLTSKDENGNSVTTTTTLFKDSSDAVIMSVDISITTESDEFEVIAGDSLDKMVSVDVKLWFKNENYLDYVCLMDVELQDGMNTSTVLAEQGLLDYLYVFMINGTPSSTGKALVKATVQIMPESSDTAMLEAFGSKDITITVKPRSVPVPNSQPDLPYDAYSDGSTQTSPTSPNVAPELEPEVSPNVEPEGGQEIRPDEPITPDEPVTPDDSSEEPASTPIVRPVASSDILIPISGGNVNLRIPDTMSVEDVIERLNDGQKQSITEIDLSDEQRSSMTDATLSKIIEQLPSLTTLDLSNCSNIEKVDVQLNGSLTSLNLSGCSNLSEVNLAGCTSLTELTGLSNNTSVKQINLSGCTALKNLDVSNCSSLETLVCSSNNLDQLNVNDCEELVTLDCSDNSLGSLSVKGCINLRRLYCYSNNLENLDLPVQRLEWLVCDNNRLRNLSIEENRQLQRLDCQNNGMGALDIDVNIFTKLRMLKCYSQHIGGLSVIPNGPAFQVNLSDYVFGYAASLVRSSAEKDPSCVTGAASTGNVVGVKGYDANGNLIALSSYDPSTGMAMFAQAPAKVSYGYQTNFNNVVMDVTVGDDEKHDDRLTTTEGNILSGRGGCNNGFGIISLAALIILFLTKRHS